jgi:hypothetical protein
MEGLLRRVEHLEKSKNATRPTAPATGKQRNKSLKKAKSRKPSSARARVISISQILDLSPTNSATDVGTMTELCELVFGRSMEPEVDYDTFKQDMIQKGMKQTIPDDALPYKNDFINAQLGLSALRKMYASLKTFKTTCSNQIIILLLHAMRQNTFMSSFGCMDLEPALESGDVILHREMNTAQLRRKMSTYSFDVFTWINVPSGEATVCNTQAYAKMILTQNQFLQSAQLIEVMLKYIAARTLISDKDLEKMLRYDKKTQSPPVCSNYVVAAARFARMLDTPTVEYDCMKYMLRLLDEMVSVYDDSRSAE